MDNERYSVEKAQEEGAKLQKKMNSGEAQTYSHAEQLLASQEAEESKERENAPPIIIVYRDNDLFQAEIPNVVNILESFGRKVEVKIFPREVESKDIKKWLIENEEHLAETEIITDRTSSKDLAFNSNIAKNIRKADFNGRFLDMFFEQAAEEAILGRNIEMNELASEELAAEAYPAIIRNVLENPQNHPKKVYILTQYILDHDSFGAEYKFKDHLHPTAEEKRTGEKEVAQKIRQWFIDGGIPENSIYIDSAEGYLRNQVEADQVDNWIVVDRHSESGHSKPRISMGSAKKLKLPLANFVQDTQKLGLTRPDKEKMEAIIKRRLKEKFEKKETGE